MIAVAGCAAAVLGALAPACSLPEGQGDVTGTLNVPSCWAGKFDLKPDFYAGVPYRETLQLRIQSGGDYETFSDGISILIDNVNDIRPSDDPSQVAAHPGLYNVPLAVSLPPGVTPPGVPIPVVASPARVHLTLYLQQTCRTQNVALYAMDQVLLNPDGTCDATDGSADPLPCSVTQPAPPAGGVPDASSAETGAPPATAPIGHSTITFTSLFDGNPDEDVAAKRLNAGSFHVYLADPREICPGGLGPPPRCRGELTTSGFSFYFQRGRPAQPFP